MSEFWRAEGGPVIKEWQVEVEDKGGRGNGGCGGRAWRTKKIRAKKERE